MVVVVVMMARLGEDFLLVLQAEIAGKQSLLSHNNKYLHTIHTPGHTLTYFSFHICSLVVMIGGREQRGSEQARVEIWGTEDTCWTFSLRWSKKTPEFETKRVSVHFLSTNGREFLSNSRSHDALGRTSEEIYIGTQGSSSLAAFEHFPACSL